MSRLLRDLGYLCCWACITAAACQDGGAGSTGVSYLPSDSLQPGEFVRVALESPTAESYDWSISTAPAAASYTLASDGARAVFRGRTPGDYVLRAVPVAGGSGSDAQTAALRVAEPSCQPLRGTVIGITGCCPNRFVHVDPCTGGLTALADVGDSAVGFPQGIYAVDPEARRLYLQRDEGGELHLLGINADTGAEVVNFVLAGHGLAMIEVDAGAGGLFGVTAGAEARLQRIDPDAGTVTDVGFLGSGEGTPQGVYAVDPEQHRLYFLGDGGTGNQHLVAVDTRTAAEVLDVVLSVHGLMTLRFDPTAHLLFGVTGCCPNEFATVDPSTGAVEPLTILGDSTVGFPQGIDGVTPGEHRFLIERDQEGVLHLIAVDTRSGSQTSSVPLEGNGLIVLDYVPAP